MAAPSVAIRPAMKNVLVTGATGFIGRRLVAALGARGDRVTVLTRQARGADEGVRMVTWDPSSAGDWYGAVDGQTAVVHLAGERAVGVRWTERAKQRILASRTESTRQLVAAIAAASRRPEVLVSASAIGYYGARAPTQILDESAAAGADFLAQVCVAWEAEASRVAEHGVRVVLARLGIVFGRGEGALEEMAKPFRLFSGGPIGNGEQVVSWVHVDDVVGALLFAIDSPSLSGPVNVVAPQAVAQADLARAIGKTLRRPSWLRVPGAALRARFGEGAGPLTTGQRVIPRALDAAGYRFSRPELDAALRECLA